jgi:Sensors of blue-light using FAD
VEELISLVYISSERSPFSAKELDDLLRHSRERNRMNGVTGVMLYAGGSFMQYLEGPKSAVEKTYSRIKLDRRHFGIMELIRMDIPKREFKDWSMGFTTKEYPGFDEIKLEHAIATANPEFEGSSPSHASLLLQNFWATNQAA